MGEKISGTSNRPKIYSTLTRLEEAGLIRKEGIEQDGGPEKRIYALTTTGKQELANWYATGVLDETRKDEFFIKLMLSLGSEQTTPIPGNSNPAEQALPGFTMI